MKEEKQSQRRYFLMHKEVIKTLKKIAEAEGENGILKRLLELSDILKQLNASLRLAYQEGLKNNNWKAYETLKEIQKNYLSELKAVENETLKEWANAKQE